MSAFGQQRSLSLSDQRSDNSVLPRRDEELPVTTFADMQIRSLDRGTHRFLHQLPQRDVSRISLSVAYIELNFLDRCDGSGNSIVGRLHLGHIACEKATFPDVAKHELARKLGNTAPIRKPGRDGDTFVVIVDRYRVFEAILGIKV